jgi:proteasome assembly chaperone (PAC2) family protein
LAIKLYKQPKLKKPDLLVGWPGIGNIGIITVDTLRSRLRAEEMGEIEPWDFFYPTRVRIKDGVLDDMEFPRNKFYYKKLEDKDLMFFVGEEQPSGRGRMYAEGGKAYEMANMVLDVAEKFGCRRVYTSGAAVSLTHHLVPPRVWAVATTKDLVNEARNYVNTILMSEVEGRGNEGNITGLNGLLIGVAKKRGLEGICLMGEIPDYLSRVPFPYPKASKSVLEVLEVILGVSIDFGTLDNMAAQMESVIENVYNQFPQEIRERIEQRKLDIQDKRGIITRDDEEWIKEHIDEFFEKEDRGEERTA